LDRPITISPRSALAAEPEVARGVALRKNHIFTLTGRFARRSLGVALALVVAVVTGAASCSSAPSATSPEGPTSASSAYPTNVRKYAEAVLAAWPADSARLAELIAPAALTQLKAADSLPRPWYFLACDTAGGASSCRLVNLDGDVVTLALDSQLLAKGQAVTGVTLELTTYPAEAVEYVRAFMEAWRVDNSARMSTLATHDVTDYFRRSGPPDSYSICSTVAEGVASVRVVNAAKLLNETLLVTVGALGGKHAITKRALSPATCEPK
jgi:hypothetical protein